MRSIYITINDTSKVSASLQARINFWIGYDRYWRSQKVQVGIPGEREIHINVPLDGRDRWYHLPERIFTTWELSTVIRMFDVEIR